MKALRPIALITGASTGIGAAFAHVLAESGHDLVLVARRSAQLEAIAGAIEAFGRAKPATIAIDLAHRDAPDKLADELSGRGLEPSIVVNSAGFGLRGQAAELDRRQQLEMIDLNIRALTDLSLRWVESMQRRGGGLITLSSLAGFFPGPRMAVYYATKAYVLAFTEALHTELSPRGVKVTVVCPGPVATEFHARAGIDVSRLPRLFTRSAGRVARQGYEGFMRGQRLVIPGTPNKVTAILVRVLPRAVVLDLAERYQLE